MTKHTEVPLVGCGNHKLHLDVLEAMGKEERKNRRGVVTQEADGLQTLIRKIDLLMGELKTLKNASLLRSKTDKDPTRRNDTRWGSILKMLLKWFQLREAVSQVAAWPQSVVEKIPTATENQALQSLVSNLKKFESVSKTLQGAGPNRLDLLQVRTLFDKLIADFGELYPLTHIRRDASIINNPDFENGILKILDGREAAMTRAEEIACAIFLKDHDQQAEAELVDGEEEDLGYAASILRNSQQAKKARGSVSAYRDVRHVSPNTVIVERLFGKAKHIMTPLRRKMDPDFLNMLLFLKANRKLWPNAGIIQKILNDRPGIDGDDALAEDEIDENA